jgi:hypothetical protein
MVVGATNQHHRPFLGSQRHRTGQGGHQIILVFYTMYLCAQSASGFRASLLQRRPQLPPNQRQRHHPARRTSISIVPNNNAYGVMTNTGAHRHVAPVLFSTVDSQHHEDERLDKKTMTITLPSYYCDVVSTDDDQSQSDRGLLYPSPLHHIHVCSVLSPDMAARCLSQAREHAKRTGCWDRPDEARHATYATCDFAVEACPELDRYLKGHNEEGVDFHARILDDLSRLYHVPVEDMEYLDFFCAHYQARPQRPTQAVSSPGSAAGGADDDNNETAEHNSGRMDRLEAHRDGSLLSYTVTLSPPTDFTGGGTFFDALRRSSRPEPGEGVVRPSQAGQAVLHCGKLLHGADVVTSGERTVLVGFVDVRSSSSKRQPGVLSSACKEWGRMDEAKRRFERQRRRKGQPMAFHRWLPNSVSALRIRGFTTPVFRSVENRADPEFQRLQNLKAEDMFLRTALRRRRVVAGSGAARS